MEWPNPLKPAELSEERIIQAILDGTFPINSLLPSERDLSVQLGITRPTLRETLQRLARDGWLDIRHGRQTRVKNYWQEGNIAVLAAIARHSRRLPDNFIPDLLAVRKLLAPAYTRMAIENNPEGVIELLQGYMTLEDMPHSYSQADLDLHRYLAIASKNPVFTMILNGLVELYLAMGERYFEMPAARRHAKKFYSDLEQYAQQRDSNAAERMTTIVMAETIMMWQAVNTAKNNL